MAFGLDIGTCNLVSATKDPKNESSDVEVKSIRDAFLDIEADQSVLNMLKMSNVSYVQDKDTIYIVGEPALSVANLLKREVRRPLSQGVISAGELEAERILMILLKNILSSPRVDNEIVYFSVPAKPIDKNMDVVYHEAMFKKIIESFGYRAVSMNEAAAIVYSNGSSSGFSALSSSFGSGMVNTALVYRTMVGMSFSLARCVARDFPIITSDYRITSMELLKIGDKVLDANGTFVEVTDKINNGEKDILKIMLEGLPSFPLSMTPDHKIFTKKRFGWDWVEAKDIKVGDTVGVPTINFSQDFNSCYIGRENGANIEVHKTRDFGRFVGVFLGDGSVNSSPSMSGSYISIALNIKDTELVNKYEEVIERLFSRTPEISPYIADNIINLRLHYTIVAEYFKKRFYTEDKEKTIPFYVHEITDQMAIGILEGIYDSDGYSKDGDYCVEITSEYVISLIHHLLNRFGIKHTISKRLPRLGGINKNGRRIIGTKCTYSIRISGKIYNALYEALVDNENKGFNILKPDFMEYTIKDISTPGYTEEVYDIKVASTHHSFSSLGMVVHNCGDWIDQSSAIAVGATATNIMTIKEKGVNLLDPTEGNPKQIREREAIIVYYRNLIHYVIDNIIKEFKKNGDKMNIQEEIPWIIGGGTAKAKNFLEFFKQEFDKKKDKFDIPISEIRMANDPLADVAKGLLIAAMNE